MKLSIKDKTKKDLFIALFQNLKNFGQLISVLFEKDHVFIQGMDNSHVCLYEVKIMNIWFDSYETSDKHLICFDSHFFYTIISIANETTNIELIYEDSENDYLNIHILAKEGKHFHKYFKIPLADMDYEIVNVTNMEHEVEFSMLSKKMSEIMSQMMLFGSDVQIKCSEEGIHFITGGISGEMKVDILMDDLKEYSIIENDTIDVTYSLNYVYKMCMNSKLSNVIHFSMSKEFPMKVFYDLGDNSYTTFFIAPKISD